MSSILIRNVGPPSCEREEFLRIKISIRGHPNCFIIGNYVERPRRQALNRENDFNSLPFEGRTVKKPFRRAAGPRLSLPEFMAVDVDGILDGRSPAHSSLVFTGTLEERRRDTCTFFDTHRRKRAPAGSCSVSITSADFHPERFWAGEKVAENPFLHTHPSYRLRASQQVSRVRLFLLPPCTKKTRIPILIRDLHLACTQAAKSEQIRSQTRHPYTCVTCTYIKISFVSILVL